MPVNYVRNHFGNDFFSPIQQFIHDGYNEMLFGELPLNSKSNVVIVGGHVGVSAQIIIEFYDPNIQIFEPIPEFCVILRNRFSSSGNVRIIQAAAASFDGFLELSVSGEKTGTEAQGPRMSVPAIDFSHFIQEEQRDIALLEMNIEGGEFSVLPHIIQTGQISKVKILLIQFHKFSMQDDLNRALIHQALAKTHRLVFKYDWIWEKWELI